MEARSGSFIFLVLFAPVGRSGVWVLGWVGFRTLNEAVLFFFAWVWWGEGV